MWTEKDREKYKDDGRRYPSDLTDVEWDIIKPLFGGYFTFTADMREVVNGCFYLEHTGCPWRSLPTNFGAWQTVRTWYDRFRTDGVWADAAAQLTRRVRRAHGRSTEPATGILDSQSVVSGPQQGERGFDGNKKIKGVKRHVLTCSLGFVLAILVTALHRSAGASGSRAPDEGVPRCKSAAKPQCPPGLRGPMRRRASIRSHISGFSTAAR